MVSHIATYFLYQLESHSCAILVACQLNLQSDVFNNYKYSSASDNACGGRSVGSGREGDEGATGHPESTPAKTPMAEPGVRLSDRGCKVL